MCHYTGNKQVKTKRDFLSAFVLESLDLTSLLWLRRKLTEELDKNCNVFFSLFTLEPHCCSSISAIKQRARHLLFTFYISYSHFFNWCIHLLMGKYQSIFIPVTIYLNPGNCIRKCMYFAYGSESLQEGVCIS